MARILVIEPETGVLNLIVSILRSDGHAVTEASDPTAALSILEQRQEDYDIVLTDAEMQPVSGFEFARSSAAMGIHIPVLFTSSYPYVAGVIASNLGKHAVIDKPFTASALRKGVAEFIARHKRRLSVTQELPGVIQAA